MPAPLDRDFDVTLVGAECVGFPAYALHFDQHCPAPHNGIEDKAVAPGTVLDGIRYQSDRLDSRKHRKFLKPIKLRSAYAGIVPSIRTEPAMLTKFERVDKRRTAVLPHERRRRDRMSGKVLTDDSAPRRTGGDGWTRSCTGMVPLGI